jgi:hexosaminidase
MKRIVSIGFLFLMVVAAKAQQPLSLVPMPSAVQLHEGSFVLSASTVINCNQHPDRNNIIAHLNDAVKQHTGLTLKVSGTASTQKSNINITLNKSNSESYQLVISANAIDISGSPQGVFYAIKTLEQLLAAAEPGKIVSLPQLVINDSPRYAYRGMHLDVSRHFYTVAEVKRYIDYLAAFKFNTFHWHLTDDQGWRIEIKKYPLLTKVGGFRNGTITGHHPGDGNTNKRYGGFYTQEQIKEVVRYAAARYITVMPEIEMPGHACAAIAAYPKLSCFPNEDVYVDSTTPWAGSRKGKQVQQTWGVFDDVFCPSDYTFNFLQDVLTEVMQLFPSKYIHIGGDECPKAAWKRSDFCQQLMKEKGLKDEHELQSYFIQRIEKFVNSKGRKIIGWDEILEGGLAPNAAVMSWRGEEGGKEAAKQQHNVVMTPGGWCYFDHSQFKNDDSLTIGGYTTTEKVYGYEPMPAEGLDKVYEKYILGAQANLWTEYISNEKKLQYMIFPRMVALSEVLWSPKEKRNWSDFKKRMPAVFKTLQAQQINFAGLEE